MPIIYTYPKLKNPVGDELVVITDPNDKKFTKQITLSQIAGLIPGGGGDGCSTAITSIVDGQGANLFAAAACSPMALTSADSSVSITSIGNGIDLQVTIPDPYVLPCASKDELGGISADTVEIEQPEAADNPVYYPVQIIEDGCKAVVGIQASGTYELPCAGSTSLGGIKAFQNTSTSVIPTPSEDGLYYPIEVLKNELILPSQECTAVVRIPSSSSYVLPCSTPTTLGGIKTGKVTNIEVPSVSSEGNYYPVETISTEDPTSAAECTAVVKIPNSQTVNDGTLTITVDGTPNTFTANQAGNTNVSITTGGGGGSTDNGFTPLSIYDGKAGQGAGVEETIFCQTVVEDACVINKVDYGAIGGNSEEFTIALFKGTLDTSAGSSATLIGWGEMPSGTSVGINTMSLSDDGTSTGNDITIEAGDDIIIMWSKPSTVGGLLGKGVSDTPTQSWLAQRVAGDRVQAADLTLGETVTQVQSSLPGGEIEASGAYRLSLHFYKGETQENPTERFEYTKCANVAGEACDGMPDPIYFEAESSALLNNLIFESTVDKSLSCCYVKGSVTDKEVTPNIAILTGANFTCDSLPDQCLE